MPEPETLPSNDTNTLHLACCQFDIAWEDKPTNHARVEAMLAEHAPPAGAMVLLPEMFATGFTMNANAMADDDNSTLDVLQRCAMRHSIHLLGGRIVRSSDGRAFNEAALVGPDGEIMATYHKLHPFSFAGENEHYAPGERAVALDLPGGVRIAPLICYDLRFPEAFRATAKRQTPHLYVVIACWPAPREAHWLALLRARAIENQAYVAGCNRIGADPKTHYSGRSVIFNPQGDVVCDAGSEAGLVHAELNLTALRDYRSRFPALADMRDDLNAPTS